MAQRRGWVKRLLGRSLPTEQHWSGQQPDHEVYIRPDMSLCCSWHEEHAFHVAAPLRRDHSDDPSWNQQKAEYIRQHLG
jgi:hypothetical protein